MLLFFSLLLSLLALILFAVFAGIIASVLATLWLYSKKYNPESLRKLKYIAISLIDAVFVILGTFIILAVIGVAISFIAEAIK